jgi:putative ABC transport system permease protein
VRDDLRYAARLLRLSPSFTLAAVLSLGLGIGANTAIFQLLEAIRLRTLPVARPGELVEIAIHGGRAGVGVAVNAIESLTYPMWEGIRAHQQAMSSVFAWARFDLPAVVGGGDDRDGGERRTSGIWVSGEFFSTLGLAPHRGRLLNSADDRRGCAANAAVLSYTTWQRWFGGRDTALGQRIAIGGQIFHVAGVTPPSFHGPEVGREFDVALPLCTVRFWDNPLDRKNYFWLVVMGRLSPGWNAARASAHVAALSPALMEMTMPPDLTPAASSVWRAFRLTARDGSRGVSPWRHEYENALWLLLGITGLVVLIACANVANLMLARAAHRTCEFAVRRSLGASPGRLVLQSLAESLLLAAIGTLLGIVLAQVLSRSLVLFLTTEDNRLQLDLGLDWMMLAFTSAAAAFTCLACGLAPGLRAARTPAADVLKAGGGMAGGYERFSLQRVFVVVQIAVSMVLVLGAWLFVGSLRNLLTFDAGFRQDGLLSAFVNLSNVPTVPNASGVTKPEASPLQLQARKDALLERIRAVPDVQAAAAASHVPLVGMVWTREVEVPATAIAGPSRIVWVSPSYFHTMGMTLLAGRDFNITDTRASRNVVVVNQTFVRRYLAGVTPIGARIRTVEPGGPGTVEEVIGVVQDAKYADIREEIPPVAFGLAAQEPDVAPWMAIMIRTSPSAAPAMASTLRRLLADERVPTPGVVIRREQMHESLMRERLMAWLAGFFGVVAALLAAIGLYGVMSYIVARRANEIAVRIALGARRSDVLRLMLGRAFGLLAIGLPLGALAGSALGRTASGILFGLSPADPGILILAALALAAVALAAAYAPAARAARVPPAQALRG